MARQHEQGHRLQASPVTAVTETFSRKRDPIKNPSRMQTCHVHGRTEFRRYSTSSHRASVVWRCCECDKERSKRSRLIAQKQIVQEHYRVHPEQVMHDDLTPKNPICPTCYTERANSGSCLCD